MFLRRSCWPDGCLWAWGLSCRRAVQSQPWLKLALAQSECCSWGSVKLICVRGSVWDSDYANESQVCFLGQVESYAGNKSCVHRVWDKEKTMECQCGDLSTTHSMKWARVLLGHFFSFSLYQVHQHFKLWWSCCLSCSPDRACWFSPCLSQPARRLICARASCGTELANPV